jgi:hypothetical protein
MKTADLTAAIDKRFTFTAHSLHQGGLDVRCVWDFYAVTGDETHLIRHNSTLGTAHIPEGRPLTAADLAERMRAEAFRDPEKLAKVVKWLEGFQHAGQ